MKTSEKITFYSNGNKRSGIIINKISDDVIVELKDGEWIKIHESQIILQNQISLNL